MATKYLRIYENNAFKEKFELSKRIESDNKKKVQAVNDLLKALPAAELKDFVFKLQNDTIATGATEGLTKLGRDEMSFRFSTLFEFAKSIEAV